MYPGHHSELTQVAVVSFRGINEEMGRLLLTRGTVEGFFEQHVTAQNCNSTKPHQFSLNLFAFKSHEAKE